MDIEKVFHMKGGVGDTSYSMNSSLQKRAADKVKHITEETMEEMFIALRPESLGMADLGCSSGPNTLSNVRQLVDTVENACRKLHPAAAALPEFRVYLNDLPTNDFNTLFQALPDLNRELITKKGRDDNDDDEDGTVGRRGGPMMPNIYIAGCPGTFYGRLFPDHCLHFVYSSNSLHWLSKVPPGIYDEQGESMNKKSIYISERSPREVSEAYLRQFKEDFSLFLKSRSEEVVGGGRMVLILLGRSGPEHVDTGFWEILYQTLATLVSQGEIEEEKLESYDVHFYAPSKEELEEEVIKEGSFKVEQVEMFKMEKDGGDCPSYGVAVARAVRSVQESMIAHHFG
ncbi:hypothetical protein OROGR_006295 [Orobanche gracilis]